MFKLKFNFKRLFSRRLRQEGNDVYTRVINWSIYLMIFLLPLFFLPLAYDSLEFVKTTLFYLLVLIGVIAWLARAISLKKYEIVKTAFNLPVLLVGLAVLLAGIFSVNRFVSFWGTSNLFNETVLSTFFFVVFFFLLVNNFQSLKEAVKLLMIFILSLALVMIFNFCQLFGLDIMSWFGWPGLPLFNLLAGSINILSVFMAAGAPIIFVFLMLARKSLDRVILTVLLIVNLALIFILAKPAGIVSLIVGLFVLLFFISWRIKGLSSRWLIIPIIIIALAVISLFFPFNGLLKINLPSDIQLAGSTGWQITTSSLKAHPFFGVGPQVFYHAFGQYKPASINQTDYWNLDFAAPGSQWLKVLATLGLVGLLAWLFLILKYFLRSFWRLSHQKVSETDWFLAIGVFAAWTIVLVAGFLISFSFILSFLFWFLLTLGVIIVFQDKNKEKSVAFADSSWAGFKISLALIFFLIVALLFLYFGTRTLISEIYFTQAGALSNTPLSDQQDMEAVKARTKQVNAILEKAISNNPDQARLYFSLAQNHNLEMRMTKDKNEIQNLASASLLATGQGMQYSRGLSSYYQVAGNILEELQQGLPQANTALINVMKEAVALNPVNPTFHLNLARAYIYGSRWLAQTANSATEADPKITQAFNQYVQSAEQEIRKAVELKDNWLPAIYYLALINEQQGKIDEAVAAMEKIYEMDPSQPETNYELGRLYKGQNRPEEAIIKLKKAIELKPDFLEAYMELIDIYESGQNLAQAKIAVNEALAVFPDNAELLAKQKTLGK
ncbi:MAG: tetratricopeptide repeat protein [bacterium]